MLVILTAVATALLIGDFGVRLATSTGDDSPAVFARLLLDPARFHGDIIKTYGAAYGMGTLVHWGPALLLRVFGIAPETTSLVLVYLQNILFACSVWLLARCAGEDRTVAWFAAVFALAAEVYIWNLANLRSQMAVPYAAHLVLPFLLFAFTGLLRRRWVTAAACLAFAALIHPTTTLLALVPIGAFVLWQNERWSTRVGRLLIVSAPGVLLIAAAVWLIGRQSGARMSAVDQLAAMRANVHMNPFHTQHFWASLLPTAATCVVLLVLGFRRAPVSADYRRMVALAFATTVLYGVAHVLAVRLGIIPLLTFIPLRFMSVLVPLALPLCIGALAERLRRGEPADSWAAGSLLVLHPLSALGAYWPPLAVLLMPTTWRWSKLLLLATWLAAALLVVTGVPFPSLFTYGARIAPEMLLAGIALAGLIAWVPRLATSTRLRPVPVFCVLLPLFLLQRNAVKGAQTAADEPRALYEAQRWAAAHTAPPARFILEPNISWRVIAQRGAIQLWPADAYVYSRSHEALQHARAVRAQYQRAPFRTEMDVLQFRERFGGDYLVRFASRPALFRSVYRNQEFVIYELPTAGAR